MKFVKRDGTSEEFDKAKIISGLQKAGASAEQAEKVALTVEKWAMEMGTGMVKATEVWQQVVDELGKVNQAVAKSFEDYRKGK